jgi:hypothetical protein
LQAFIFMILYTCLGSLVRLVVTFFSSMERETDLESYKGLAQVNPINDCQSQDWHHLLAMKWPVIACCPLEILSPVFSG